MMQGWVDRLAKQREFFKARQLKVAQALTANQAVIQSAQHRLQEVVERQIHVNHIRAEAVQAEAINEQIEAALSNAGMEVDHNAQKGAAGIYNAAALYNDNIPSAQKFEMFKDAVLSVNPYVDGNLDVKSQHELIMGQLESNLPAVNAEDQSVLQDQLNLYHQEQVAQHPEIDPVLSLDLLLKKCDQANSLQAEVNEAGGAKAFLEEQASAVAFFNAFKKPAKDVELSLDP